MVKKTTLKERGRKGDEKMVKQIIDIEFVEDDCGITMQEYLKILHYFDKNLVNGIELERNMGSSENTNNTRIAMTLGNAGVLNGARLQDQSTQYKKSTGNKYNVACVKGDSSVRNGVEVIFGGVNENFNWIRQRLFDIEKKLDTLGAVDFCSSSSNHISFITLQDKLLNPTIVKNIFNLTRAFSPALYWMGAGDHSRMHRGSNYCRPQFQITPIGKSANRFLGSIEKYSQCNCGKTRAVNLAGKDFTSGLYVEFRHVDGLRVPTALTCNVFLLRALIYKALSMSRKGVMKVESMCDWSRTKTVTSNLLDRNVNDEDCDYIREQAIGMIDFLLPELKSMCADYIPTLYEIATKPVYARSGSWKKIEKELKIKPKKQALSENEEKFLEGVFDGQIKAENISKLKKMYAEQMGMSERMVEHMIKSVNTKLGIKLVFDKEIQTVRVD